MKKLLINVPIFDVKVIVIVSDNVEDVASYIEDVYNIPWQAKYADGITYQINNDIIIGLKERCDEHVIVHEICHTVFALDRILGLEHAEETWCYLSDYLYNVIKSFIYD